MDTLTFITIITALATLIGAISPIIVAFIQSNKDKQQNSVLLPPNVVFESKTKINWFVVFSFAILSGIIGYVGAKIIRFEPPIEIIETPDSFSTSIVVTSAPQGITTFSPDSSVLFSEDFEDGKAQKVSYISGNWQIIIDETGNKVYDIDNSKSSGFPGIDFGSESWKDYEIKFRVKFLDDAWAIVYFRNIGATGGAYVASIDLSNTSLSYTTNGSNWKVITDREYPIKKNTWYWVSIEANGSDIQISINDYAVISTDDTLFTSGRITMQAGQFTHMQVDDIQVISLGK